MASGQSSVPAQRDLVLVNGKIWTGNSQQPEAGALLIRAGRIAAIGGKTEILSVAGSSARVVDLAGRRVVPGFNDAHLHFFMGGNGLASVQLRDAKDEQDFQQRIADFAGPQPRGEWILNGNWDHKKWVTPREPDRRLIDPVTPDTPVFVSSSELHSGLANTLAMKLAGVDKNTKDVPGGIIERDSDGNPTGIFRDSAKSLIEKAIPAPSDNRIVRSLLVAQKHAAENGVTSVQDMGVIGIHDRAAAPILLRAYLKLLRQGTLHTRVSLYRPLAILNSLADAGITAGFGDDKLRIGGLKAFADGSLGSKTAWFFEPYSDAPGVCGIASGDMVDPSEMYNRMRSADESELQLAIHAIGDRANRTILEFYERLLSENGARDRRARIEHAQHLRPSDIGRFAKLQVIASVQPYHCIDDGCWADKTIGHERAKTTYACRSLLDAKATLAFGSDWPVAPISPLLGIYAAVTRRTLDEKHPSGWVPEQKISVAEAVYAYTMGGAYATGEESVKGSLEPGKLADLAVLSSDIFQIEPEEIRDTKIDMTILQGEVIFERN